MGGNLLEHSPRPHDELFGGHVRLNPLYGGGSYSGDLAGLTMDALINGIVVMIQY